MHFEILSNKHKIHINMKRNYLLLLMLAMLSPWLSRSQAYIGDYVFSSFAGTFSSISNTGTQLSALEGTDASTTVTLPFAFPFGRDTVSQIWVTPYGQIGMGLDDPADYGYETHTNDMDIIVPLGQYYYLSSETGGGHVYYEVQGANTIMSVSTPPRLPATITHFRWCFTRTVMWISYMILVSPLKAPQHMSLCANMMSTLP